MPSNTVLTPDKILRAAYAVMHQKSNFIMRTNRQYDGEFAREGVKIGQQLRVRLPAKFTTRTGNTMASQNYVERSVSLPLATIKGVDMNFGQEELTFSIEDFTERVIMPAASQLIADVEAHAMSMYTSVANFVGVVTTTSGSGLTYDQFDDTGVLLTENLAPRANRTACLQPRAAGTFRKDTKSLFQSADNIRDQYVEGLLGRTGGYDVFENTLVPSHTTGGGVAGNGIQTTTSFDGTGNAWSNQPFTVVITGAANLKKGDIIYFNKGEDVHPETKQPLGYKKRFVVQEDAAGASNVQVKILPVPIVGGAYANVSEGLHGTVTLVGTNGTTATPITYKQSLMFHRDAFAFVTADLLDPSQFGAWGGRRVEDNLSLRIWRQGDIVNGNFPCRLDIAYGFVPIYPEWAVRHVFVTG